MWIEKTCDANLEALCCSWMGSHDRYRRTIRTHYTSREVNGKLTSEKWMLLPPLLEVLFPSMPRTTTGHGLRPLSDADTRMQLGWPSGKLKRPSRWGDHQLVYWATTNLIIASTDLINTLIVSIYSNWHSIQLHSDMYLLLNTLWTCLEVSSKSV